VRDTRLNGPPLVIAAHGSADPRFADVVESLAAQVRALRPGLDVRVGYLEHCPPTIDDVTDNTCVVVPLLLASGYHVRIDVPAQAPSALLADAVGPDSVLAEALSDRLGEVGYDGRSPVVLAAAGSSDKRALDDVQLMAGHLNRRLGVDVTTAFVSAGSPRLSEVSPRVVSSYLLAPGRFHDAVVAVGAAVTSAPIGAHPAVAQIVLARYDATQVPGRIAPA
jgi:sirohydrochlorin ferrochelatase